MHRSGVVLNQQTADVYGYANESDHDQKNKYTSKDVINISLTTPQDMKLVVKKINCKLRTQQEKMSVERE